MVLFYSIILGIVQGLTEFLPVSSTAHLVLIHELTGFTTGNDAAFDIVLQLATSIAALFYFRKDVVSIIAAVFSKEPSAAKGKAWALAIVLGTIPAVLVGVAFEHSIEAIFRNSKYIAVALIAGSILMFAAERAFKKMKEFKDVNPKRGVIIGLFQALALIPGISRSGATISGALFQGLERNDAVKFSFLLSIPVMFGAAAKKLLELDAAALGSFAVPLSAGFIASFIVGFASIHFLTNYLRTKTFNVFIWYRVALACVIFLFL